MTTKNSPARTAGRRQPAASESQTKSLKRTKATVSGKELLDLVCPAEKVGPVPDPAHQAASVMLATGLRAAGISVAALSRPGLIVRVHAPSSDWVKPLRHAWVKDVAGKEGTADGVRDRGYHAPYIGTLTFSEDEAPSNHDRRQGEEAFARAVALQSRIVGFSSDPAWLPGDLVAATDRLVELSPLSPGDIANLAKRVTGSKPKVTIAAEDAEAVTPRLARLAVRPYQEADDFIHRLVGLARADRAAAKQVGTAGPRKAVMGIRATPTLDRIHGMDAAVRWGLQLRDDLQAFRMGERSWSDVDRGLLLSGPPGTGKTLFARALAATCGVPLISGSYGTWLAHGSGHQGDLLIAMRKSFREARTGSPSILFVDEVDAFADRARVTHHPEWHLEIVNTLLAELDGVEDREGVVVVAACNYPEMLDPALVRGGRLDRHIRVGLPDADALGSILRVHLEGALQGVDLSGIGLLLLGSTGADVERMVRGARRRARLAGRDMDMTDLVAEAGGDVLTPHSVSTHPRDDESFMGYVFRLAKRRLAGSYTEVSIPCGLRVPTNQPKRAILQWLALDARVPVESLEAITRGNLNNSVVRYRGFSLPRRAYTYEGSYDGRPRRRVCPDCLRDDNYHRALWDLVFVSACPVHRVRLVDTCIDCGKKLRWIGADTARCGGCRQGDLTRHPAQPILASDLEGTAVAYGLLGDVRFAAEAVVARSLPPFADLAEGAILDFMLRTGLERLDPRRGLFSLEKISAEVDRNAHVALSEGLSVARRWPDAFLAALDDILMEALRTGRRINPAGLVEKWVRSLPDGSGEAVLAALEVSRLKSRAAQRNAQAQAG